MVELNKLLAAIGMLFFVTSCIGLEKIAVATEYETASITEDVRENIFKLGKKVGPESAWAFNKKSKGGSILINISENKVSVFGIYLKRDEHRSPEDYLSSNDGSSNQDLAEDQQSISIQIENILGGGILTKTKKIIKTSDLKPIYLKFKEKNNP